MSQIILLFGIIILELERLTFFPFKTFFPQLMAVIRGVTCWLERPWLLRISAGEDGMELRENKWKMCVCVYVKTLTHEPKHKQGLGARSPFWIFYIFLNVFVAGWWRRRKRWREMNEKMQTEAGWWVDGGRRGRCAVLSRNPFNAS